MALTEQDETLEVELRSVRDGAEQLAQDNADLTAINSNLNQTVVDLVTEKVDLTEENETLKVELRSVKDGAEQLA